ncbi:hypothetical protein CDAR_231341 [Caerostris darwini]|uniref:Uncharacterized protein n=1 Tax=Caerostris darwini TaxID=1538125 RepID=A0AAV4UYP2_9ARAC|nr:hypothetical protein CDAR_231341 [Caerostris darwini]
MQQGESCKHSPRDLPLRSRWLTANKKKPELTADQTLAAPKCHALFFTAMVLGCSKQPTERFPHKKKREATENIEFFHLGYKLTKLF